MRIAMSSILFCLIASSTLPAQSPQTARQIVDTMLAHEGDASEHRNNYMYLSEERSDRTADHLWTERVVETSIGKMRLLIAEDGQPLNAMRAASEKALLDDIATHPDVLRRKAATAKEDEVHAERMLVMLHRSCLFDAPRVEGDDLRIAFRPDPAYQPQTLEERVLHAMAGSILVNERTTQLHRIEGRLPADVSLGFGLLGTIHAGSSFSTVHEVQAGNEWKSSKVDTEIDGKAIFFKAIGRREHSVHHEFKLLPNNVTVSQAVAMLEQ